MMTAIHGRGRLPGLVTALLLVLAACAPQETAEAPGTTEAPATTQAPGTTETPAVTEAPEAGGPIRIGALTSLTGPFTAWGVQVVAGMQLAVDEINAQGGVDGRMLELVTADTQNNAEEAVTALERLVEQDGVVAVGGIISSDVGLATSRVAEELGVPLFLVKAGSPAILTRESRYTFRTCLPAAPMTAGPILQYVQGEGLERIGAIIADYAWGQTFRDALLETFEGVEGVELQIEVAPVGEQDFTTYLRSLEPLDPQLVVATGHPPGTGPITIQSGDLGMDVPVTGAWSPFTLVMGSLAEAGIGRYTDYSCVDYFSDGYQDLARRFLAASDLGFLEDDGVAGYGIATMVAEAVGATGDDPTAIAEWLHGQSFDLPGYAHEVSWTEWGELASSAPTLTIVTEGPAPEGVNEAGDWWLELLVHSDPLEVHEP